MHDASFSSVQRRNPVWASLCTQMQETFQKASCWDACSEIGTRNRKFPNPAAFVITDVTCVSGYSLVAWVSWSSSPPVQPSFWFCSPTKLGWSPCGFGSFGCQFRWEWRWSLPGWADALAPASRGIHGSIRYAKWIAVLGVPNLASALSALFFSGSRNPPAERGLCNGRQGHSSRDFQIRRTARWVTLTMH